MKVSKSLKTFAESLDIIIDYSKTRGWTAWFNNHDLSIDNGHYGVEIPEYAKESKSAFTLWAFDLIHARAKEAGRIEGRNEIKTFLTTLE